MRKGIPSRGRFRVLFVDDQPDVARTLAGLLDADTYDIAFAGDGESAWNKLHSSDFDLVVVDLRMPPGQWGGLWLLERMAQAAGNFPALVLSGDAGQQETIQALRLGALDFVVKEQAVEDLCERVSEACSRSALERARNMPSRLPRPIAEALHRVAASSVGESQLRASLEAVEAALRFGALTYLARLREAGRLEIAAVATLASPSMGTWSELCRKAQRDDDLRGPVWAAPVDWRVADSLVTLRNDLVHGATPTLEMIDVGFKAASAWLERYLIAAERHPPGDLAAAGTLQFNGTAYQTELLMLMGLGNVARVELALLETAVVTERVYVLEKGRPPLPMWPFALVEPGPTSASRHLLVWDGFKSSKRGTGTPVDPLRHINVDTGQRLVGAAHVGELCQATS